MSASSSSADARKARFGVTHGRRRIAIHRAEVALPIHQRVAHVEALRHAHERVINRRVAVGMKFAEDFAGDLGALAVGLGGGQAHFVHAEKNAPMHGLQAVAHVGQRAPDDHAHGIVEIRLLHLGFDIHREEGVWISSAIARLAPFRVTSLCAQPVNLFR